MSDWNPVDHGRWIDADVFEFNEPIMTPSGELRRINFSLMDSPPGLTREDVLRALANAVHMETIDPNNPTPGQVAILDQKYALVRQLAERLEAGPASGSSPLDIARSISNGELAEEMRELPVESTVEMVYWLMFLVGELTRRLRERRG